MSRAPGAAQRAALAAWCAADPGPMRVGSRLCGAPQRGAAPRPGHECRKLLLALRPYRLHVSNSYISRHCERLRSNPSGRKERMDCFVASAFARRRASADRSAPRNDGKHDFAFPRRESPGLCMSLPPPKRAWGMPGAQCTRSLVCQGRGRMHTSSTGPPKSPGIPARNGLRLTSRSPRRSGFLVTVASRILAPQARSG
jgi:hypothetical protein